jgi:cysteine desulfurase
MERIYLDNAATTPLDKEVLDAMLPYMTTHFGNPSSIYSYGRETKLAVENARKSIATILGAKPGEIFFTSGGTESNNTAIIAAIRDLNCTHIITSPLEHHAVLHTVEHYHQQDQVGLSYVSILEDGKIDYDDLENKLSQLHNEGMKPLVSLMHANNEIGTLLDLKRTGNICEKYNAIFHSDCVQTVGHYPINLHDLHVHFISATAHKFHGPKGTGILYVNESVQIKPLIFGGGQERNLRAGTENVYGIVGFAKALEVATRDHNKDREYIKGLRNYLAQKFKAQVPGASFNGDFENGLYTVLSVCFPKTDRSEFLLMNLDINNICVSGGSACSSGADIGSHVMQALGKANTYDTIRFSFSKYNTKEEIDRTIEVVKQFI